MTMFNKSDLVKHSLYSDAIYMVVSNQPDVDGNIVVVSQGGRLGVLPEEMLERAFNFNLGLLDFEDVISLGDVLKDKDDASDNRYVLESRVICKNSVVCLDLSTKQYKIMDYSSLQSTGEPLCLPK